MQVKILTKMTKEKLNYYLKTAELWFRRYY